MFGKLYYRLLGANHYRHRGDRFFLDNNFARALGEYRRARAALGSSDYRVATLDALVRECAHRIGDSGSSEDASAEEEDPSDEGAFPPGLEDLFELAIAEKSADRAGSYREQDGEFQAGYVALVQGDAETSVHHFEQAARKGSSSFVLQLELGRALSLSGNMERAKAELSRAHRMRPTDTELLNLLAAVDIQLGHFEEAAELIGPLVEKSDIGPETLFLFGKSLASLGKHDQALERYRQTVEIDARFHEAYFEAAKIVEARGEPWNALRLLVRACAVVPDEVPYNLEIVRLVLDHRLEEEAALAACDRLMVTDEENHWRYLSWIAELYVRRGWRREARDPLRKALKLIPFHRTDERQELERKLAELEGPPATAG